MIREIYLNAPPFPGRGPGARAGGFGHVREYDVYTTAPDTHPAPHLYIWTVVIVLHSEPSLTRACTALTLVRTGV